MAIRIRKGKNKPYQVYWRNPRTGRQESKAFSTMLEARKYEAEIKYRIECQPETFKAEAERSERSAANHKEVFCLEDVFIAYLREKQFNPHMLASYVLALRPALEICGRKQMGAVSTADLAAILSTHQAKDIKKTSVVTYMHRLFTVLHWAKKRGYVQNLPSFPELPAAHSEHFIPPTPEEIERLYMAASPHIQRVIVIGANLGVRVGSCEMFKLKWTDFDFQRNVCRVPAANKNKAEPWREVPLKQSIVPLLKAWRNEDTAAGLEMVLHFRGKPFTRITAAWQATCRRAGITRRIRPYDLRHAFATYLIAGGADVGTVARLMGHANVNMVLKHYQHVLTKQKEAAIAALPDLPLYDRVLYDRKENVTLQ